jgi:hypothetical protein
LFKARMDSFSMTKRVEFCGDERSDVATWPHPESFYANPSSLAQAGFFYDPTWHWRDKVTCFTCGFYLVRVQPRDDPYEMHWSASENGRRCACAQVACGIHWDLNHRGQWVSRLSSFWVLEGRGLISPVVIDLSPRTQREFRQAQEWNRRDWLHSDRSGHTMTSQNTTPPQKRSSTALPSFRITQLMPVVCSWRRQVLFIGPNARETIPQLAYTVIFRLLISGTATMILCAYDIPPPLLQIQAE